jgi:hypothetical protein
MLLACRGVQGVTASVYPHLLKVSAFSNFFFHVCNYIMLLFSTMCGHRGAGKNSFWRGIITLFKYSAVRYWTIHFTEKQTNFAGILQTVQTVILLRLLH